MACLAEARRKEIGKAIVEPEENSMNVGSLANSLDINDIITLSAQTQKANNRIFRKKESEYSVLSLRSERALEEVKE